MAEHSELKDFLQEHGKKLLIVLIAIIAVIVGITQYAESQKTAAQNATAALGQAMTFVYSGEDAAALRELDAQMGSLSGLALAKASLLAGNIKFRAGDYDGANALFEKAIANAGSADLILSGALHGQASVSIEKKEYEKAASQLQAFIQKFGKRTGNLEDRYAKDEPADAVPTVPDALWKLALCYNELGKKDLAKSTAEKLLKIYGDRQDVVSKVQNFLASL